MVALQLKNVTITCHLHFHPFSTLASGLFLWCAGSWPALKDHYVQLLSSHQHPTTLCWRRTRSPHYQSFGNKNLNLVTNLQRSLHMLHFDAEVIQDVLKDFKEMLEKPCSHNSNNDPQNNHSSWCNLTYFRVHRRYLFLEQSVWRWFSVINTVMYRFLGQSLVDLTESCYIVLG